MSIEYLQANISKLTPKDAGFAKSMLEQYDAKGHLSPKQMHWIEILAGYAEKGYPNSATEKVGNFKPIIDMLKMAKEQIKYPKVKLTTDMGSTVALSLSGDTAKYPGSITVTDGLPFNKNKFYGWIMENGDWQKTQYVTDEVVTLIHKLALDPAATAGAHGHLTGNCCFCNRPLKDAKSTSVGYGPICAEVYGLPWGKKIAHAINFGMSHAKAATEGLKEATEKLKEVIKPMKRGKRMAHEVDGWDEE